jgi:hypothetical protein
MSVISKRLLESSIAIVVRALPVDDLHDTRSAAICGCCL